MIYDLCDELFISLSTIKNELQKVKRKLLSTLLYNESNVNFVNLKSLQNSFLDIDIPYIKNTVYLRITIILSMTIL